MFRICFVCRKMIPEDVEICPYCGTDQCGVEVIDSFKVIHTVKYDDEEE